MLIWQYDVGMARTSTTADVFNAIGDVRRREILDVLIGGEKPVGAIVDELAISQPQVSKHLRVLSEVGLVAAVPRAAVISTVSIPRPATAGRLDRNVRTIRNERFDRLEDYLGELQRQEGTPDEQSQGAP